MTTYNTGNPVGSTDVRDLYDNAQNLDSLVNGPLTSYADRLGAPRKSWRGLEEDFAAFLAASGFELPALEYVGGTPLVVDRPTQLIFRTGFPDTLYGVKSTEPFPATLSGTWSTDEGRLVVRSDGDLRQDIANSTDPAKGAGLVGWNRNLLPSAIQTVAGILSAKPVSVWEFASLVTNRPDPADHETWDWQPAFTAALALHKVIDLSSLTYRIASKVTVPGGKHIISDGALIIKDFAGVGLEFVGGSSFNYVAGTLYVTASAAHTADTSADSAAPTEHGVNIVNNRLIVDGTIISTGHKGSGFKFDSTAPNSNRCILSLRGRSNGVHGVHFSGTHDDCSVWRVELFCDGNRKSGVYCDDDFAGRNWQGFVYTESNCKDNAGAGCYLGKLRASELFIYSEEQQASARDIVVGANCSYLDITSARQNKDDDYSAATQRNRWRIGQKSYTPGYPGGPRNGVAASFHAVRARITQPTEYVDIPLLVGNEELVGSLRGWGGATSPSIGVVSADGLSSITVENGEARITIAGTLRLVVGAGFVRTPATTVANLPAAATAGAGARAFVTDANATTFASVVAGGGSNGVPVYSDGTNWRIG